MQNPLLIAEHIVRLVVLHPLNQAEQRSCFQALQYKLKRYMRILFDHRPHQVKIQTSEQI